MSEPSVQSRNPLLSDRQGFDRRWYAPNVQLVYAPTTAQELAVALAEAEARYGAAGAVKVVSGRHCYERFVYDVTTRVIVDVSLLRGIGYDPGDGFWIESGNNNWNAYVALLNGFGVTLPAGSCYSVGAGGHICGGGYGVLSRLFGLTVDWLTAVDIVCRYGHSDFKVVHASADSPDPAVRNLFWACRGGGGGNFGAIARYYFKTLPTAPAAMAIETYTFPWSTQTRASFEGIIRFFERTFTGQDPASWYTFAILKLSHKSAGQINIIALTFSNDRTEDFAAAHDPVVAHRRDELNALGAVAAPLGPIAGHPVWIDAPDDQVVRYYTFLEGMQYLNGSGPNQRGKYKSAYMKQAFPAGQVDTLWRWLHDYDPPPGTDFTQSLCQVDAYGGQINRVAPNATPVPQRSSIMKLQYQTYWQTSDQVGTPDPPNEPHLDWIRRFYTDMYLSTGGVPAPGEVMDGCYYNYPDVDLGEYGDRERALLLYFKDNLRLSNPNLVDVKTYWDGGNFFQHPQSIPPRA
jgi:hexose oxidase